MGDTMRSAILLATALLAGCMAPIAEPPTDAVEAARFPWVESGCREIIATFDVDTGALQAALPEGFTAASGTAPGRSPVGIDAFECEDGSYASFWAVVEAPEGALGEATAAFVKWDTLVQDPPTLAALQAAGAHVRGGTATVRDALPAAGGTAGEVVFDDIGTIRITVLPSASRPGASGEQATLLREWSPTDAPDGSLVMWEVELVQSSSSLAPGFIELPPDAMAAQLYGSTRIPSLVGLGLADLRNGTIALGWSAGATG